MLLKKMMPSQTAMILIMLLILKIQMLDFSYSDIMHNSGEDLFCCELCQNQMAYKYIQNCI